jgi:hypothetical protein
MARTTFDAGVRANSPRHQSLWRSPARALTARLICRAQTGEGLCRCIPWHGSLQYEDPKHGEAAFTSSRRSRGLRPRHGARWRPSLRISSVWRLIGTRLSPAAADARGLTAGTRSSALKCEVATRLSQLQCLPALLDPNPYGGAISM